MTRRSRRPGPAAQVPARAAYARRRRPARRPAPAHGRPAPRGGRAAGQPVHHVLHVPRAGPPGAAVGAGPGRAGRRAADVRRRTPLPPRPGLRPGRGQRTTTTTRPPRPSASTPPWPTWSSASSRSPPWSRAAAGTCWPPTPPPASCSPTGRPRRTSERNLVRWMFTTDQAREVYLEWEPEARALLGRFRLAAARYPDDPDVRALIAELQRDSEHVRDWWPRHDVTAIGQRLQEAPPPPPRPRRVLPRRPPGRRPARPDPGHLLPATSHRKQPAGPR